MKKITLFLDPVLYYLEDSSGFASPHYIDLHNGDVVAPELEDAIGFEDVEGGNRYFRIEPITSHESYEIMQDFAAAQESDEVRGNLFDALERKKPFRNFKNTLADYPGVQEKFYKYKDARLTEILRIRLEERGYELEEAPLRPLQKK